MKAGASRPLLGQRILVTRPRAQAGELIGQLEELGAEVLLLPGLVIRPPISYRGLDEALQALASFDWLIFTSQNAVAAFFGRAADLGLSVVPPPIAAVGPRTAFALQSQGHPPQLVPREAVAEALALALEPIVSGRRLLLPRAERAAELLPVRLRAAGAEVLTVDAYRSVQAQEDPTPVREALVGVQGESSTARRGLAAVLFTSERTVSAVLSELGSPAAENLLKCPAVCIGPVTASACRRAGFTRISTAQPHTEEGLVDTLLVAVGRRGTS